MRVGACFVHINCAGTPFAFLHPIVAHLAEDVLELVDNWDERVPKNIVGRLRGRHDADLLSGRLLPLSNPTHKEAEL